jgi:hypothetical protein
MFSFLFVVWGKTESTWYVTTKWPIVPALDYDDDEYGAVGGKRIGQETKVPLCLPQIPHDMTWDRTQAAMVGSQWQTALSLAWPAVISKSLYNSEDEKKLSKKSLSPTLSLLAASSVTIACVAVIVAVACFLSLPKFTVILYLFPPELHSL